MKDYIREAPGKGKERITQIMCFRLRGGKKYFINLLGLFIELYGTFEDGNEKSRRSDHPLIIDEAWVSTVVSDASSISNSIFLVPIFQITS